MQPILMPKGQQVVNKLSRYIIKMINHEKTRIEVESFILKYKKFGAEMANEIFKSTKQLQYSPELPEILNLIDSLCKQEKETFAHLFEENINKIFLRVYKNVHQKNANTKPLRIMRKSWFSYFSRRKLDLIQRTIKTVFGEDIDAKLTQKEIDDLRQYYIDSNIQGFESFLYQNSEKVELIEEAVKKPKSDKQRTQQLPQQTYKKRKSDQQKVSIHDSPPHYQQESYQQQQQQQQVYQFYNYAQIWQPEQLNIFTDLFANNYLLNVRDKQTEFSWNKDNTQQFVKNKSNEVAIPQVVDMLCVFNYRCSLCRLRFRSESRYIEHLDRHAKEHLLQLAQKSTINRFDLSLNEEDWLKEGIEVEDKQHKEEEIYCTVPYDSLKQSSCCVCSQKFQGIWDSGLLATQNVVNVRVQDSLHNELVSLHLDCFKTLQQQEQTMSFNINHPTVFTQLLYSDGHSRV